MGFVERGVGRFPSLFEKNPYVTKSHVNVYRLVLRFTDGCTRIGIADGRMVDAGLGF